MKALIDALKRALNGGRASNSLPFEVEVIGVGGDGNFGGNGNKNFDAKPGGFSVEGTAKEVISALATSGRPDAEMIGLEIMMSATPTTRIRVYENMDGKICVIGGSGCGDQNCTACSRLNFGETKNGGTDADFEETFSRLFESLGGIVGSFEDKRKPDWRKVVAKIEAGNFGQKPKIIGLDPATVALVGKQVMSRLDAEERAGGLSLAEAATNEVGRAQIAAADAAEAIGALLTDGTELIQALLAAKADEDAMKERAKQFKRKIYGIPGYVLQLSTVRDIIAFIVGDSQAKPELPNELGYDERQANRFDELTAFLRGRGEEPVPPAFVIEAYGTTTPLAELIAKHFPPEPVVAESAEEPVQVLDETDPLQLDEAAEPQTTQAASGC